MIDQIIEAGKAAAAVSAIVGLPILAWKGLRALLRTVRKLGRMADEVLGDGEDRPGWGRRIAHLEDDLGALRVKMREVLGEVKPNGGSSMRDQISRIEEATGATRDSPGD